MTESLPSRVEYFSKLSNPYFIIPAWVCWFVAMATFWGLAFHSVFIGPIRFITDSDRPVISAIALLAMSASILAILPQARGFFTNVFIIVSEADHLIGVKMFGVPAYDKFAPDPLKTISPKWLIQVALKDIIRIKAMPYPGVSTVQFFVNYGHVEMKVLEISSELKNIGALLERILPSMVNLRSIELKKYTQPNFWDKEPDWTIINAAKLRAEENRKKNDPLSTNDP